MMSVLLLCVALVLPFPGSSPSIEPGPDLHTISLQPAGVDPEPAPDADAAASAEPRGIDLAKVFTGEQKLTAEQLVDFGPWIGAVTSLVLAILSFIPRLIVALFLLGIFWLLYRTARRLMRGALDRAGVDQSINDMLLSMVKWTILGFGLVVACNQLGIPIVAMLTGVSIIGLAVGFAAQETLANFIAGIVIFWDKPFRAGDWIEVEGHLAEVKRVTFRSTRLEDLDADILIYPNTAMLNTKIVNKSTNKVTRCNVSIGIAYKESIQRAREVLLATLQGDRRIVKHDEAEVIVVNFGPSSVDLLLRFWMCEERYEDELMHEYMEKAKVALDAAGIEIPFPHMQVLVEDTPALMSLARPEARTAA